MFPVFVWGVWDLTDILIDIIGISKGGGSHVDCVCVWLGAVCRNHCHSGKMRDSKDGFECGDGNQDDRGSGIFMADGVYQRFAVADRLFCGG